MLLPSSARRDIMPSQLTRWDFASSITLPLQHVTRCECGINRIAIVDYDAHHGNGTQAAFMDDERVAYCSTHQWGIYPGTGWYEEAPHAKKRIVNVPFLLVQAIKLMNESPTKSLRHSSNLSNLN